LGVQHPVVDLNAGDTKAAGLGDGEASCTVFSVRMAAGGKAAADPNRTNAQGQMMDHGHSIGREEE
jgi:hypothetical protein